MGLPHTERKVRCTVHLYPNLETINTSRDALWWAQVPVATIFDK